MEKVNLLLQVQMKSMVKKRKCMKETGSTIKWMDMDFINTNKVQLMKDLGFKIDIMVMENMYLKMELYMRENGKIIK